MKQASDTFTMDLFPELLPSRRDEQLAQIARRFHLPGPSKQMPSVREEAGNGSRNS